MTRDSLGRRAFLALTAPFLLSGQSVPGPAGKGSTSTYPPQRFLDPATEFDLSRLTDPQYDSSLPAPHLRFISRRGNFLVYASERSGSAQVHRLDWHNGESRQLTAAAALDRTAIALAPDDKTVFYCDGAVMKQVGRGESARAGRLAAWRPVWERAPGWSLSADGRTAVWVERRGERSRLRVFSTVQGASSNVVAENAGLITDPQLRPGKAQGFLSASGFRSSGWARWAI